MKNLAIVAYTHTDMKDVWNAFFTRLERYVGSYTTYVAVNAPSELIPSKYIQLHYNDSNLYTDRWLEVLEQMEESVILFLHEDMILYDQPDLKLIEVYAGYVQADSARSIKLISTDFAGQRADFDSTLIESNFSVQPTLIKKELFIDILKKHGPAGIWDFEKSVTDVNGDYMVKLGDEKKRGLYHYDSKVFPYIATAISKGRWNYSEYKDELRELFEEFEINAFIRGIQ